MSRRLARWRSTWAALPARDRRALSVLAVALGLFVYALGVLMPLRHLAAAAQARHASALAAERAIAPLLVALGGPAAGSAPMPAPDVLAADARAAGLDVTAATADPDGRLRLDLAPGNPEAFVRWLDGHRDGPWMVVEARLAPEGGRVGASLVLAPRP